MLTALTPKQQCFCDEYLMSMNATHAALKAGYSRSTAMSGQLMLFPKIKAYIAERTEALTNKIQLTQDMVVTELAKVAFANMGDYFGDDGKIKPMNELSDEAKAALWNVKVSEKDGETTVTLRMHNKMAALGKLVHLLSKAPAPQPEVIYVYLNKEDMDAYDLYEDQSFDEPEAGEVDDDNVNEDNATGAGDEQDNEEQREQREKEIRLKAVRETEERLKHEHERQVSALKRQMAENEEEWLKKEAKAFGIPSKTYIAHIMNNR